MSKDLELKKSEKIGQLFDSLMLDKNQIIETQKNHKDDLSEYALVCIELDSYEKIPTDKEELEKYNNLFLLEVKLYFKLCKKLSFELTA